MRQHNCSTDEITYRGTWPCGNPVSDEDPEGLYCSKHMTMCMTPLCRHPLCPDHFGMPSLFDGPEYWLPLMTDVDHMQSLVESEV